MKSNISGRGREGEEVGWASLCTKDSSLPSSSVVESVRDALVGVDVRGSEEVRGVKSV